MYFGGYAFCRRGFEPPPPRVGIPNENQKPLLNSVEICCSCHLLVSASLFSEA